jgi:hypothetical protein
VPRAGSALSGFLMVTVDSARKPSSVSDRPGMLMRKRLLALLNGFGPSFSLSTGTVAYQGPDPMLCTKQPVLRRFCDSRK